MKKWEKLAESLQKESAIMGYRNTAENLKKLFDQGLATIVLNEEEIIAFAALWPTDHANWLESGSIWVHPEFRGHKHASAAFQELLAKVPDHQKILLITHSVDPIIHLVVKHGFQELAAHLWDTHVPFAVTCGPCDKTTKDNCPLKAGECRLFFLL